MTMNKIKSENEQDPKRKYKIQNKNQQDPK